MNKGLKIILQVVLGAAVVALAWMLVRQIMSPLEFQKEVSTRSAAVVKRIVDIRAAEQAFKTQNQRYTGSFDTLIDFVLSGHLELERRLGDADDSVAVQRGLVGVQKFTVAVRDTIFSPRRLSDQDIRDLRFIPFAADGTEYELRAAMLTTESKVIVPVFEAKAPFTAFLADQDPQELVNLIDDAENVFNKYPGIAVGSVERATNDAGNWE